MVARKPATQTETFWRDRYEPTDEDTDLVASLILDAAKPQQLSTLVSAIIRARIQREKDLVAQQSKRGRAYRPVDDYAVGDELVFTALDYAVGRVMAVRSGHNPKYEDFGVVRVAFEDGSPEREFAASFGQPHPLNRPPEELMAADDEVLSEADMVQKFEHYVAVALGTRLESDDGFVQFDDLWFLTELIPDVHVGYLNLAEAMIYEAGRPLAALEMVAELDLGTTGSLDAQLFAFGRALRSDDRFDDVGTASEPVWYLRALEPEAAFHIPEVLVSTSTAETGEFVGLTMLDLVDEIGDELDDVETMVLRDVPGIRFEVTFPHLYAGTLPLTYQFQRLLPTTGIHHLPITLVDTVRGQRIEAWAVSSDRYVCGLSDWYASVGMPVGGQIQLAPTDDARVFTLSFAAARSRRSEWIRSAVVVDGELVLQMQRANLAIRSDRNVLIGVPDMDAVAAYMVRVQDQQPTLNVLMRRAFGELAKLSGRGIVHAKSVYSVVNMMMRSGAVPVFAELTRQAAYDRVGDGFWAYDQSLEGSTYTTPQEMRERPLSSREDLMKDQVVQYMGR